MADFTTDVNDCPYFHGSAIYYSAENRPSSDLKILEIGLQNDILSQLQLKEPQHRQNFRALGIWISCLLDWSYINIFTNISSNFDAPLFTLKDPKCHPAGYQNSWLDLHVLTKKVNSFHKHLLFCQGSNIIYER